MKIQEMPNICDASDALVLATKYTAPVTIKAATYDPNTGALDIELRPIEEIRAAVMKTVPAVSDPKTAPDMLSALARIEAKLDDLLDDVPTETEAGKVPLWRKWLGLDKVV